MKQLKTLQTQDTDTLLEPMENILHDIKIPLTIMYTKIQLLEETQFLSEEVTETLDVLKRNWFRIMKLLNDIDDYEKISKGKISPNLVNSDIIQILYDITKISSSLAYKKNIILEFTSNTNSKITAVDKEILERIMLNLISNAIKYTDSGSRVIIKAEVSDNSIKIYVKDNGQGIQKNKLDKIFDRYVIGSNYGTGIGLNIVKELVELLQGTISLKSSKKGTEFIIELPCFEVVEDEEKLSIDNFYSYNIFEIELSDDYNI